MDSGAPGAGCGAVEAFDEVNSPPTVSAILVSFHHGAVISEALRSLKILGEDLYEIFVVDNGGDLEPGAVQHATLLTPGENLGFAEAVNRAVGRSSGEFVLLLSPDAEVVSWHGDEVARQLDPGVGAIGALTIDRHDRPSVSWGDFPGAARVLRRFSGSGRRHDEEILRGLAAGETSEVPWILGAALLINRSCYQRLGGLDARYRTCGEDQDLGARLRRAGLLNLVSPAWTVRHEPRDPGSMLRTIRSADRRWIVDHGSRVDRLLWWALGPLQRVG